MGASAGKAIQICTTDISLLSKSERAHLSQHTIQSPISSRIAQFLLIAGYFRSHGYYQRYQHASHSSKLSLDLVFLCFDFHLTSSPSISYCLYLNHLPSKLNRHAKHSQNKFELIDFMQSPKDSHLYPVKQTVQLPTNLTTLQQATSKMCCVSDIGNISNQIHMQSACIVRCGQKQTEKTTPNALSLSIHNDHQTEADHCSAIVFNNSSGDTLHGVEMSLPSFAYSVCDDMIYCPKQGLVAYQSYNTGGCNKLYLLNKQHSEWQPLARIAWHSLSPGMLCDLPDINRLFVSTKRGESVVVDFEDSMNWKRIANTMLFQNTNNDDLQCMAYDSGSHSLYRAINGTQYFQYSLHKNQWTYNKNMELNLNQLTRGSRTSWNIGGSQRHIVHQTLSISAHRPNVLHTAFSVSKSAKPDTRDEYECVKHPSVEMYSAFFDERDCAQKWRLVSSSTYTQSAIQALLI